MSGALLSSAIAFGLCFRSLVASLKKERAGAVRDGRCLITFFESVATHRLNDQ